MSENQGAGAYLYANGNALYFDEQGQQIADLQTLGLCGLREYVRRYPLAICYWDDWRAGAHEICPSSIPWLLRHLRDIPGPRPSLPGVDDEV